MKNRKHMIVWICLLAIGCRDDGGFSTVPPTDTKQTNQLRRKLHLRPIKESWSFYGRQGSEESWTDQAGAECKRVGRDQPGGAILWEEDYYYSGRTWEDPIDGTGWEMLTIHYVYGTKRFHLGYVGPNAAQTPSAVDPAVVSLLEGLEETVHGQAGKTNEATLSAAEKILARWGLKRL